MKKFVFGHFVHNKVIVKTIICIIFIILAWLIFTKTNLRKNIELVQNQYKTGFNEVIYSDSNEDTVTGFDVGYNKGYADALATTYQGVKEGDIVYYTPNTQIEDYSETWSTYDGYDTAQTINLSTLELNNDDKWIVFDVNVDTIEMIPDGASAGLYLNNADGYNNAVKLLNDACYNLYSDYLF